LLSSQICIEPVSAIEAVQFNVAALDEVMFEVLPAMRSRTTRETARAALEGPAVATTAAPRAFAS
jgi:hypothetical protein